MVKPHFTSPYSLGRKLLKERGIKFPGPRPGTYEKNCPRDPLSEEMK
jgi:hypothetical protein